MPYTLNGIGTRYVGRKNASVIVGSCPSCGRNAQLSDYDTREWFCLVFVPVIPLRKFRVQSDCASCRKHHRIPLAEFRASVEANVRPLEEAAARRPADGDAAVRLVEARIAHRQYSEAEEAARRGLHQSPKHTGLNLKLGDLLAARGDHAGAVPHRRLVAAAEPQNAGIRRSLGRSLFLVGQHEEACRELAEAVRLDPSSTNARLLLAEALFSAGRFAEALQRLDEVTGYDPTLATDKHLLARKNECKKKLGFPVTAAERKAARRWWPFGGRGRQKPPVLAKRETNWKAIGIVVAAIVVVGVAGSLVVATRNRSHPDLYLVNGLSQNVTVTIDAESFQVSPGPVVNRSITPGRHHIVAKGKSGAAVDTLDVDVPVQDLVEAIFEPRVYVYNVSAAALLLLERAGYSDVESQRTYSEEVLAFQGFFGRQKVDFVFLSLPEKVDVKGRGRVEFRTALNVARDLDYNGLGTLRWREGKKEEAERCVRKAVSLSPCGVTARRNLQAILSTTGRAAAAVEEARAWIAACPTDPIEPHRAYQGLREASGERDELLKEYGARLAARPDDAAAHYLYGRLLDTAEGRLQECEAALALAPGLTRARISRGLALMTLERYADALGDLERSVAGTSPDGAAVHLLADAAIAGGDADRVARLIEARRAKEPHDAVVESASWRLMLARRQWDAAERALRDKDRVSDRGVLWTRRAQLLGLAGRDANLASHLEAGKVPKEAAEAATFARFEQRMTGGKYREAVAGLDRDAARDGKTPDIGPLFRLHQAAGLYLAGEKGAGDALARDVAADANADPWIRAAADGLLGTRKRPEVLARARVADFHALGHVYCLLGVRAAGEGKRAEAEDLYRRSERACTDLEYPVLLVRHLLGPSTTAMPRSGGSSR